MDGVGGRVHGGEYGLSIHKQLDLRLLSCEEAKRDLV